MCFLPGLTPGGETNSILLSVWCELSSSTRAQGGAVQSLGGGHLPGQPLLGQRVEGKMRPGSAQPMWGPVSVTMAWTPVLMLFSQCTGKDRTQGTWAALRNTLPEVRTFRNFSLFFAPINTLFRFPGSLSQPLVTQPCLRRMFAFVKALRVFPLSYCLRSG